MFDFLVNADGGLTTAGYTASIVAVLVLVVLIQCVVKPLASAMGI